MPTVVMPIERLKCQTISNIKELQAYLFNKSQNSKYPIFARDKYICEIRHLLEAETLIENIGEDEK